MAEKILRGINFPGLEDTYIVPEVDDTLSKAGASADAKVVGDALSGKQPLGNYVKTVNGTEPDENGNVTIEVGSGSIEQVQPNWDQTDETAVDFIKNKPFGVAGYDRNEFIPAADMEMPYISDFSMYGVTNSPTPEMLTAWQSEWAMADVVWDGVTYTCELKYVFGLKVIGNASLMLGNGDDGIPFIIAIDDANLLTSTVTLVVMSVYDAYDATITSCNHNVSVTLLYEQIDPIDPKFITEVPWSSVIDKPFYHEKGAILDVTFQDTGNDADGDGTIDYWDGELFLTDTSDATLIAGQTYTITINGVKFTSECALYQGIPMVGNTGLYDGNDNGIPFVLLRDVDGVMGMGSMWACLITGPSFTAEDGIYTCKVEVDSLKHLDNKYLDFMDVVESQEILPEQTITFNAQSTSNPSEAVFYAGSDANGNDLATELSDLTIGETYTVSWNGVDYTCTAVKVEAAIWLGNRSVVYTDEVDTGEPFLFSYIEFEVDGESVSDAGMYCYETSGSTSTTRSIRIYRPGSCFVNNKNLDFMDVKQEAQEILPAQTLTYELETENTETPEKSEFWCSRAYFNGAGDASLFEPLRNIKLGVEYTVVFDGTEYKCVAQDVSSEAPSGSAVNMYACIGNAVIVKNTLADTGEPFIFVITDVMYNGSAVQQAIGIIYNTPDVSSVDHTVSIKAEYKALIKPEYLPADISGGAPAFTTDETLTRTEDDVLKVNVTNEVAADNYLPISSAAVYEQLGNINALLAAI